MKKGVLGVLSFLVGCFGGIIVSRRLIKPKLDKAIQFSDKHLSLYLMMNQWVKVKQEGKKISSYFEKNGFKKIAIYGMSYAGETLLEELRETEIKVAYSIDKNADKIYSYLDIVSLENTLEQVDAIVVTAITFYEEIKKELNKKIDCPIISLEDILYEI